jgi:hypothetical protein
MTQSLQPYRFRGNRYSQNGEDGVIAEICRRLGVESGWFCEFGAWDGRYGSNCYAMLRSGWRGVMIEGEPMRCIALRRLAARFPGLVAIEAFVDPEPSSPKSLDNLLATTAIPHDFAVLSIDIDGLDYAVWSGFSRYRPLVVIIEIDSSTRPGLERVADGTSLTSFSAMLKLGLAKGYRLVAHTGNMLFVRDDHVAKIDLPEEELTHPETLFVDDWVNPTRLKRWRRKLRHMTPQRAWIKLENLLRK